ncbi:hypothetical protein F4558_001228 [Micromonospora profundi]|nr:hypothetical protein [Micromonospora profundi]
MKKDQWPADAESPDVDRGSEYSRAGRVLDRSVPGSVARAGQIAAVGVTKAR